ncbi:MAG: nucleoside hydrolase [Bacteroidales bacterium]
MLSRIPLCLFLCLALGPILLNAQSGARMPVLIDTDANNELDDQHALAYLLLNQGIFDIRGITVNATSGGGPVAEHAKEAQRIVDLCGFHGTIRVTPGADGGFAEIVPHLGDPACDGREAVDLILKESRVERDQPLILLPVGKLTHIALALKQDPDLARRVRVVWLGSNYPEPGEYNQDNDTAALNFILQSDLPFEIVTVRYGKESGTGAVKVARRIIYTRMPGQGPLQGTPVTGRHGGEFTCFGDYSVDLFKNIENLEEGCYRSLFDLAAVAIVKDPSWAEKTEIPAPILRENQWIDRPANPRTVVLWENFNREEILEDLFTSLEKATGTSQTP